MFLRFIQFYYYFIQGFSQIIISLTLILRILRSEALTTTLLANDNMISDSNGIVTNSNEINRDEKSKTIKKKN